VRYVHDRHLRVTAKTSAGAREGVLGLVRTKVFSVGVALRDGSSALRVDQRVFRGFGRELPNAGETREAIVELAAAMKDLAARGGALNAQGELELTVRVRVWNNRLHLVFKDDVLEVMSIIAVIAWFLVLAVHVLRAVRTEASKHREEKKLLRLKHEIAHESRQVATATHHVFYLLATIAAAPWRATMEVLDVPISILSAVLAIVTDVIVETFNLFWVVTLLNTSARERVTAETYAENAPHYSANGKPPPKNHRIKHGVHQSSPPRKRSTAAHHGRKDSDDILLKRLVIPESIIEAQQRAAEKEANEALQHAQSQIRSKANSMNLRDSNLVTKADVPMLADGDIFADVPGLSSASLRRRPSIVFEKMDVGTQSESSDFSSASLTHSRQQSAELHARQNSLVSHMLDALGELDSPPDPKSRVIVPERSASPRSHSTLDASFNVLWSDPAGKL